MIDRTVWGVALLSLALAAAGSTLAAQDATEAELSAEIPSEMKPEAGQYRSQITFESFDMPGAPPELAGMMRQRMSREFSFCLTPDEAEEGYREIATRSQEGDCEYNRFDVEDGAIDAAFTCKADGRTFDMTLAGTGTPTTSNMLITMAGDMGMGPGTVVMRVRHERIGACS
ncbi:MAG: DUF3617 domain-containing protein [Erythrobacter sp.]